MAFIQIYGTDGDELGLFDVPDDLMHKIDTIIEEIVSEVDLDDSDIWTEFQDMLYLKYSISRVIVNENIYLDIL